MLSNIDYKLVYDRLYEVGYHDMAKNHGERYVPYLVKKFGSKVNRILDVGCSQGMAVRTWQRNNIEAWGVDVSEIAIRKAVSEFHVINCVQGNAIDLPFKDKFFDGVFTCDCLEHLAPDDVEKAIREIKRVTKYFVWAAISSKEDQNKEHLLKARGKFQDFPKMQNLHLSIFDKTIWTQLFMRAGFKFDHINKHDVYYFTT